MGCGKSKHAIETATTVIKSTNTDGTKHTATKTKTVKETTTGTSLIQKETETKSLCVEDTDKKPVTDIPPSSVAKIDNVATDVEKSTDVLKEDVLVKDSENVAPALVDNAGKAKEEEVRGNEKVNGGLSPTDASIVVHKDDVGAKEVVIKEDENEDEDEDEEKRESTLKADADNVVPIQEESNLTKDNITKTEFLTPVITIEEDKMKESNLIKDNMTKMEFLTPTLGEEVVGPFETVKDDDDEEEVMDSQEEIITMATSDENPLKTIEGPSDPKDDNLNVEEPELVTQASESIKVDANKEEDVAETEVNIKTTETEKASPANGENPREAQEDEP